MTEHERLLREVLVSVEWGGSHADQDGRCAGACPACGGVNPKDRLAAHFVRSAWGHRPDCRLDFALTRLVPA